MRGPRRLTSGSVRLGLLVAVCALAPLSAAVGVVAPVRAEPAREAPPRKLPPLEVTIDKSRVDLEHHRLEVRMSRKAGRVELKVYDAYGAIIAEESHDFAGKPAGARLSVTWTPRTDDKVAKIEVFAYDAYEYYKGIAIVPWTLSIPHEDVTFATDSSRIEAEQEPKLEASYRLIAEALKRHGSLGPIKLFIAGHTDTRGSDEHNLKLSRRRARALAHWFRQRGLGIPIRFEGFGEHALLVKTEDEVDEPRNRRADYVLAIETPRFKTTGRAPAWKKM